MQLYLVITRRNPDFDPSAIAPHYAFLDGLRRAGHSGGAYLLHAENLAAAETIAHSDPLHLTHSSVVTVHEWNAQSRAFRTGSG